MGNLELHQALARHNSLSTYFWTTNKQAQVTYIWIKLLIKSVFLSSHHLSSSWSQLHSEGGGHCLFLTPIHSQPISHSLYSLHSTEAALTSASSDCPPPHHQVAPWFRASVTSQFLRMTFALILSLSPLKVGRIFGQDTTAMIMVC